MASRHYGEFEILDFSKERSIFSFNVGAITALSLPGFLTQFGALRAALVNIIIGTLSKEKWVGDETFLSNVPPVNSNAQRELYWRVTYEDFPINANGRAFTCQIATPDLSLVDAGKDEADYSKPAIAAFITAFEALVTSPEGGDIIVANIDLAGRRR